MEWITLVATSSFVAAIISGLLVWLTGLHRDRETARRDRLFAAVSELLAAEMIRWRQDRNMTRALDALAAAAERGDSKVSPRIEEQFIEAKALYEPALVDALNALSRIRLISPDVYEAGATVVTMDYLPVKSEGAENQSATRSKAIEFLVTVARKELRLARRRT